MPEIALTITPDPDDPGCADVFVNGTIQGHPYRFILDTGAAQTHVVADDFTSGFRALRGIDASGLFASNEESLIRVPDVTMGALVKQRPEIVRYGSSRVGARNLLGMDVLGGHRCLFAFDTGKLIVGESMPERSGPRFALDLQLDETGHPLVDLQFPELPTPAVWDSGAGITIVAKDFVSRHPQLFEQSTPSIGTDAAGARIETPTFIMVGPQIGGVQFAPHRVASVDLSGASDSSDRPLDFILGYTTLRQADWFFDFPARRWAVARAPSV